MLIHHLQVQSKNIFSTDALRNAVCFFRALIVLGFICYVSMDLQSVGYSQEQDNSKVGANSRRAIPIQLQLLAGETVEGDLVGLTDESISLSLKSGNVPKEQMYSVSEVAALKFRDTGAVTDSELLKFADGSIVRCRSVTGKDNEWTVVSISGVTLSVKPSMLSSLQFANSSKAVQAAFDERIATSSVTDEMLIVRPGDTVDRIPGIILGLDNESVSFSFDGQTIPAPRSKLAGLVWAQPTESTFQPTIRIKTMDGSRWEAVSATLIDDTGSNSDSKGIPAVAWKLRSGTEGRCVLSEIASIDYSNAIVRWMASLPALESKVKESPYLKSPIRGRELLMTPYFSGSQSASSGAEEPSSQNLVFPVDGSYTVRVPEGVSNFRSRIVRPEEAKILGEIRCEILSNDEVIWSSEGVPPGSPWNIELSVVPEKKLKLVVHSGSGISIGSKVTWIQPRFTP